MSELTSHTLKKYAYKELLLGDVTPATTILIVLHWMGGTAEAMAVLVDGYAGPLRAIFLEGAHPFEDGLSWFPDGLAFYDLAEGDQAPEIRRQGDHVAGFLKELRREYPNAKIAMTGMSQGGDITLSVAAYHPTLLDLALPLAGRLSPPMRAYELRDVKHSAPKVHLLGGEDDPIVTPHYAHDASGWLGKRFYEVSISLFAGVKHGISKGMVGVIHEELAALGN